MHDTGYTTVAEIAKMLSFRTGMTEPEKCKSDIHKLSNLKYLDISLAVIKDEDLSSLGGMPLETLIFMDTDLTGKGVESLKNCKKLKYVQINCNGNTTPQFLNQEVAKVIAEFSRRLSDGLRALKNKLNVRVSHPVSFD